MRSIKDKLNSLYGRGEPVSAENSDKKAEIRRNLERMFDQGTAKSFPKTNIEKKEYQPLEELVPGQWINTSFGDIFRAEFSYDLNDLYGNLNLKNIFNYSANHIRETFQLPDSHAIESILFLDTETTGLAGGSGTVAFMIGLGWVENETFIVHQYFISQLNHEEGMLDYIADFAKGFTCIASYNGKSFDVPLLNTRFVMNRLVPAFEKIAHIDFLHHSRSLWKYSLTNCKLKTLEAELMGLYREDDIPGELIPEVYFEYLEAGLVERLERVFYHNRFDIITMLGAMVLILDSIKNIEPEENPLNDYAKGRMFKKKNEIQRSIRHYENVLNSSISLSRRIVTLLELAAIYKKARDYETAAGLWRRVVAIDYSYTAYVELAKFHEHRLKNYQVALEHAEKALEGLSSYKQKERAGVNKRITRLKRKIIKESENRME